MHAGIYENWPLVKCVKQTIMPEFGTSHLYWLSCCIFMRGAPKTPGRIIYCTKRLSGAPLTRKRPLRCRVRWMSRKEWTRKRSLF